MAAPAFPLPYKYQPLSNQDSIRILILYPADDPTEPLRGQLEYTERAQILRSLSNFNTQYETVSYAWGDQKPTESILLEKDASELKITKNVDCMLRHLRKRSVKRSLWIDALCLNQDDKTEKSIQVPLMGKIYAQAKKTNIWLGNSDEETPRIWAFLRRLAALEKDQINEALLKSELQHIWGEEDGVSPTERFLCRPWFSRRWILQEVFLSQAAVVRCGNMKISWNWIASGLETLRTASERTLIRLGPSAQNTLNTAHVLRNNTGKILDLIWDFDTAKCADPRDKIFALCGLATNLTKESFNAGQETQTDPKLYPISTEKIAIEQMVDYNTGWEDVYRRFAQSCLQAGYGEEIGYHLSAFG
ncbi:HET-domain-containing protein, partial [Periconia macrospinosa]